MNKFITQGKLKQVNATVLTPENAGLRIILNLVGQDGKFEAPLDKLLAARWAKCRSDYKEWYSTQHNFKLGLLNSDSAVGSDTWICSALVKNKEGVVDPKALETAIKKVGDLCLGEKASLHVSDLLTSAVPSLKQLLITHLIERGTNVYLYSEPVK